MSRQAIIDYQIRGRNEIILCSSVKLKKKTSVEESRDLVRKHSYELPEID